VQDPRTPVLFALAHKHKTFGNQLSLFEAIGRVHPQILNKTLPLNGAGVCGAALADLLGDPQPEWTSAADVLDRLITTNLGAFEPKERWAMDWYYPVMTGAMTGAQAKARLAEGWDRFVLDDRGVRCVNDEQWVTAAETSECAIAHCAAGDRDIARELLLWTMPHRREDGAYWTGIVYPAEPEKTIVRFPADEYSAYTAAAIILAADAISGGSPASTLFTQPIVRKNAHLKARAL